MRDRFCECVSLLLTLCEASVPTLRDALDGDDEQRRLAREAAAQLEAVAWDVQQVEVKDATA